ncbi:AAEL014660-PA, partial [Aedes aegypti]
MMINILNLLFAAFAVGAGYNISPVPNVIFKKPGNRWTSSEHKQSYFGLAVHLKESALYVGAPKATTFSRRYNTFNDSGVVYECGVLSSSCEVYSQLEDRNFVADALMSGQYFGATLDGLTENDALVACTPRLIVGSNRHAATGACYTTVNGSIYNQQQALKYRKNTMMVDSAMEGFAVHVFRNHRKELGGILTGMPGFNLTGSVFIYDDNLEDGILLNSWQLEENGYFGYSVATVVVENKTIHVVGAPRSGKVYVFEAKKVHRKMAQMSVHTILTSDKFGDYYGYSLCTEDINGDGLMDVMVGVPFSSRDGVSENGAVYVYINHGLNAQGMTALELRHILMSEYQGSGQFGYSITSVGDLNRDNYNDIAVGSPFEGTGAVYIFHGSARGLVPKHSQVLRFVNHNTVQPNMQPMFGASISKAADIDGNGFGDIAVGAPTAEVVHLFRTYPLIRPNFRITFSKEFISIENATVQSEYESAIEDEVSIVVCHSYEYVYYPKDRQHYYFRIVLHLDYPFRRAKINNESSYEAIEQISQNVSCFILDVSIRASFRHLTKPVKAVLYYEIVNQNTSSLEFCDKCAIQEMKSERIAQNETNLVFKPNCAKDVCLTDLKLHGHFLNFESPFELNSSRTMELQYNISNEGESGYGTLLEIKFARNISIVKAMAFCEIGTDNLSCLINNGQALQRGKVITVNVTLNATELDGTELDFEARLFSDGNETFNEDNLIQSSISLVRHSSVSIV